MQEKKLGFDQLVYGDMCQRSNNFKIYDEDVENFEEDILEALNSLEENK